MPIDNAVSDELGRRRACSERRGVDAVTMTAATVGVVSRGVSTYQTQTAARCQKGAEKRNQAVTHAFQCEGGRLGKTHRPAEQKDQNSDQQNGGQRLDQGRQAGQPP